MKIAHVITRMILGGAQENTLLCCRDLLHTYGDDVLLVTGPALGPEGSLLERAQAEGVPLAVLPSLRRAIHPWRDVQSYRAIKRTLRKFQPDVVHTHSGKAGLLGRVAAAALGVPAVVHTVHGAPFHPYQGRGARAVFRACERYAAGKCHALISVADAMTDLMVSAGVAPRDKFTTIYSGMETGPFLAANEHRAEARRRLGYADQHVVIGKIARLFRLKGHGDVIEASRRVVESNPQVRFLFVGDGVLRKRLEKQIDAAGLGDYFQLVGLVRPERIPELISAMDVVVHTSLREGLARALPQALLSGKPVVSYDVDGAGEVVLPGRTGTLVPPRDVAALAEALTVLAGDAELRLRLGRTGPERFADAFHHEKTTQQVRKLYERVLSDQRSAFSDQRKKSTSDF